LLDLFLRERAAGRWPVSRAIEWFHGIAGPSFYRRIDVHFDRAVYADVKRRLLVDLHLLRFLYPHYLLVGSKPC